MPIIIGTFIRQNPTDNSFGVPPPPPSPAPMFPATPVLLTQRGERFTGYHLTHDGDENTLLFMKPEAWLTQPKVWSARQTRVGLYDLRQY